MHPSPTRERVKSCLNCDAIIPFSARECPSCRSAAAPDRETLCESCTSPLGKDVVFCPNCGALAMPIDPAPLINERIAAGTDRRGSTLEWGVTLFNTLTVFAFCWVLIEHLILPM